MKKIGWLEKPAWVGRIDWAGLLLRLLIVFAAAAAAWICIFAIRYATGHRVSGRDAAALEELMRGAGYEQAAQTVEKRVWGGMPPDALDPWIVVLLPEKTNDPDAWRVLGWTGRAVTPEVFGGMNTVVFCRFDADGAMRISYVNAQTGRQYDWELLGAPVSTARNRVSANALCLHVKEYLDMMALFDED